jgi:hypothetical protein
VEPARRLDVPVAVPAVEGPRDRLGERPEAGTLPVEAELTRQSVEPPDDLSAPVPELGASDQRCESEFALTGERFGVDREPGLSAGAEHVAGVKILVQEHLLALGCPERSQGVERGFDQRLLERPCGPLPAFAQAVRPPSGLVGEGAKGGSGRFPESRKQVEQDVERVLEAELGKRRPREAALE